MACTPDGPETAEIILVSLSQLPVPRVSLPSSSQLVFVTVRIFVCIKRDEGVVGITIFRIYCIIAERCARIHAHTHNNNSYYVQSEAVFIDV